MNLLEQARVTAEAALRRWQTTPSTYAPIVEAFCASRGLLPLVALAQEYSSPINRSLGRPPGYPWQHGLRVASSALRLCQTPELASAEPDLVAVVVAALFHDLTHVGEDDDHQRTGAELAGRKLVDHLPAETVARVARWIAESDRYVDGLELEQRVLWDANALDLHGCQFVVRGLNYAGVQGLPPEVMLTVFEAVEPAHEEWTQRVYFAATRRWMAERAERERRFARELADEMGLPYPLESEQP